MGDKKPLTVGKLKEILTQYPDHFFVTYNSGCAMFYEDEHFETTTNDDKECVNLNG